MLNKKSFCICIDVYKIYQDNDYDRIYEVLSQLKKKIQNEQYPNRKI